MINTEKTFKGIQPFRLGGGGTIRVPYRRNDQHCRGEQGNRGSKGETNLYANTLGEQGGEQGNRATRGNRGNGEHQGR